MRDPTGPGFARFRARSAFSAPLVVMVACVIVFAVQLGQGWRGWQEAPELQVFGAASWPFVQSGEWWRLLSYAFVHGNTLHLALNLVGLLIFGRLAWHEFGNRHWLGIFAVGSIVGALTYLAVFQGPTQRLVGASAGIYALVIGSAVRMPELPLSVPFLPGLSVRMRNVAIGLLVVETVNTIAQIVALAHPTATAVPATQVASLAHLGGALAGYLYVRFGTDGFDSMVRESERRERLWREQQQCRRREPRHVAAGKFGMPSPETPEEPPQPVNFMEDRVNPVLEKLHAHGEASLSPEEKRILDEASARLRQSP